MTKKIINNKALPKLDIKPICVYMVLLDFLDHITYERIFKFLILTISLAITNTFNNII